MCLLGATSSSHSQSSLNEDGAFQFGQSYQRLSDIQRRAVVKCGEHYLQNSTDFVKNTDGYGVCVRSVCGNSLSCENSQNPQACRAGIMFKNICGNHIV